MGRVAQKGKSEPMNCKGSHLCKAMGVSECDWWEISSIFSDFHPDGGDEFPTLSPLSHSSALASLARPRRNKDRGSLCPHFTSHLPAHSKMCSLTFPPSSRRSHHQSHLPSSNPFRRDHSICNSLVHSSFPTKCPFPSELFQATAGEATPVLTPSPSPPARGSTALPHAKDVCMHLLHVNLFT